MCGRYFSEQYNKLKDDDDRFIQYCYSVQGFDSITHSDYLSYIYSDLKDNSVYYGDMYYNEDMGIGYISGSIVNNTLEIYEEHILHTSSIIYKDITESISNEFSCAVHALSLQQSISDDLVIDNYVIDKLTESLGKDISSLIQFNEYYDNMFNDCNCYKLQYNNDIINDEDLSLPTQESSTAFNFSDLKDNSVCIGDIVVNGMGMSCISGSTINSIHMHLGISSSYMSLTDNEFTTVQQISDESNCAVHANLFRQSTNSHLLHDNYTYTQLNNYIDDSGSDNTRYCDKLCNVSNNCILCSLQCHNNIKDKEQSISGDVQLQVSQLEEENSNRSDRRHHVYSSDYSSICSDIQQYGTQWLCWAWSNKQQL